MRLRKMHQTMKMNHYSKQQVAESYASTIEISTYIYTGCDRRKVICLVEKIIDLVGNQCKRCGIPCTVTKKVIGCALVIKMVCNAGYLGFIPYFEELSTK